MYLYDDDALVDNVCVFMFSWMTCPEKKKKKFIRMSLFQISTVNFRAKRTRCTRVSVDMSNKYILVFFEANFRFFVDEICWKMSPCNDRDLNGVLLLQFYPADICSCLVTVAMCKGYPRSCQIPYQVLDRWYSIRTPTNSTMCPMTWVSDCPPRYFINRLLFYAHRSAQKSIDTKCQYESACINRVRN